MHKGIVKNRHYTWLSCAAQNMKNIAIKIDRLEKKYPESSIINQIIDTTNKLIKNIKTLFQKKTSSFSKLGVCLHSANPNYLNWGFDCHKLIS